MKITLIIITFNRPEALEAILKSLTVQIVIPDEVFIADDGSGLETADMISKYKEKVPFLLRHVRQDDHGYRIASIRNKAIRESTGDYLIFSDGDLIFHPSFIKDYKRYLKPGTAIIGSRVFLKKEACKKIEGGNSSTAKISFFSRDIENNRLNAVRIPFIAGILPPVKYNLNLRGGLLGVRAGDIRAVNGWNELFTGWGMEDSELLARLVHNGISLRKIKFAGLTYHLWHENVSREQLVANRQILQNTMNGRLTWCTNGLVTGEKS